MVRPFRVAERRPAVGPNHHLLPPKAGSKSAAYTKRKRYKTLGASPSGISVLSPSQKLVFSGNFDTREDDPQNPYPVRVWDGETGTLLLKLKGHTYNIRSGAFSSNERLLASGDGRGRVNVWNISQLHP